MFIYENQHTIRLLTFDLQICFVQVPAQPLRAQVNQEHLAVAPADGGAGRRSAAAIGGGRRPQPRRRRGGVARSRRAAHRPDDDRRSGARGAGARAGGTGALLLPADGAVQHRENQSLQVDNTR